VEGNVDSAPNAADGNPSNIFQAAANFVKFRPLKLAGMGFNLKPGLIDIPYGWEYAKRTNHGDYGNNDFITNGLMDINGTENGISFSKLLLLR